MIMESAHPAIVEPIGVLGYGVEGRSTCRYLLERGFTDITVFDRAAPKDLDPRLRYAGTNGIAGADAAAGPAGPEGDYTAGLSAMKTVFRSAGIRPDLPALRELIARGGTLTSQVGLAFALAGRDRIVGVTGTVGKGTCISLLDAMLKEAGIPAALGGNIGVPALDLAASLAPGQLLLLELSSFQLSALPVSPKVAVVLRTTSEHLDWHKDQEEYWQHKGNIAAAQKEGDLLVYCADAPGSQWIARKGSARLVAFGRALEGSGIGGTAARGEPGFVASPALSPLQDPDLRIAGETVDWVTRGFTLSLAETHLKGAFNLENIAAAAAVALELGADPERVKAAARNFRGLEHRLEFVREKDGIRYWNDSYATRPEATLGAVAALADAPLGLVLGGSEKHADFRELAEALAAAPHLKAVALIGHTAGRLRAELLAARKDAARAAAAEGGTPAPAPAGLEGGRTFPTLEEAVRFLAAEVGRGHVLLSPACASFGMFENYKERGKAFKRVVEGLG